MAQQNQIQQPGPFGGLMRYDAEYKSKIPLSPVHVIAYIIAIIILVLLLKFFFPVVDPTAGGIPQGIPGGHGLILGLLL